MMRPGSGGAASPSKDIADRPPGPTAFAALGSRHRKSGSALFWLAWAGNGLAALIALLCLEHLIDLAGLGATNHDAVRLFFAGAACGALADLAARRVQRKAHGRSSWAGQISHELLVGLAIVFLAASIVSLVLGCASMASGLVLASL